MTEVAEADLREIQAYSEEQFREALGRLLAHPLLPQLVASYFPGLGFSDFVHMASGLKSVMEFQVRVIAPAIDVMLKQCTDGLTFEGVEHLSKTGRYLYLSSHRDIILDPSLLTQGLCVRGYGTPKICLGDNLLSGQLVIDLIKMNKGVTVKRKLTPRELLRWSHVLSELIGREIRGGGDSVWIAQREGRTKDGDDRTHPGVIKMLAMAGEGTLVERLASLHLVPVAISYEYDPCDYFKARGLHLVETRGNYQKAPGEDHQAMLESLRGFKGGIHIAFGRELGPDLEAASRIEGKKEQVAAIAAAVDRQIHALYRLWPTCFVACDLLSGRREFAGRYNETQYHRFVERLERRLAGSEPGLSDADRAGIRRKMLEAYARPVRNAGLGSAEFGLRA
jgi:hypothetical protein